MEETDSREEASIEPLELENLGQGRLSLALLKAMRESSHDMGNSH